MDKDFYKLLGVDRKATDVDIKKAYRKLARKYHPDLNPGSKTAEAKFKEIQEAYSVLSDPKKKRQYDQFGFVGNAPPPGSGRGAYSSGFDGFDFSNIGTSSFGDFFQNIFGGTAHPQQKKTRRKGENLQYTMKLSFDDAINGIKTRIQLTRMVPCTVCHGNGYIMTGGMQKCPTCGGTGQIRMQKGFMSFGNVCPKCGGSGNTPGKECSTCHGSGHVRKTELISVRIPKGVNNGSKVRIAGKGNAGFMGGAPGDLFISIEVEPHKFFKREGANIFIKIPITVPEATLGAKIDVPTIYGKTTIRIPPGTRSEQKFRLRNKGAQVPGKKTKGDQFVEVTIVPPPFNDEKIRDLMKELQNIPYENPREKLGVF